MGQRETMHLCAGAWMIRGINFWKKKDQEEGKKLKQQQQKNNNTCVPCASCSLLLYFVVNLSFCLPPKLLNTYESDTQIIAITIMCQIFFFFN